MSNSFISYVWAFSARAQIFILVLTGLYFPFLYLTLDLPKQIINDAIGGTQFPISYFDFNFGQIEYLVLLSFAYLFFVLAAGVLKMQTNTYKGVVSERLLRRFRYQLIRRILRFPLPYFRQTSQGALINMVTAEAETVGGMMGEAFARPVFAAGQMITILTFLFVQSVWLGLAAIAIIPLQVYIVPRLQRRINALNRQRVLEVRSLSEQIVETVAGVEDLRANGAIRYTLAQYSKKFSDLFFIRLEIYKRKFFMKFLNNTLNQITPFLLLLIGGYLAINGQLTVGALAAALASYKDLLEPWRDLLAYYSQIQDTSLRYRTITEQFDPKGMVDEDLFFGRPDEIPPLAGEIVLDDVTVNDQFGMPVLSHMNATFAPGSFVAIRCGNERSRQAFQRALSRSILLGSGAITLGGRDINGFHQEVLNARIGSVANTPLSLSRDNTAKFAGFALAWAAQGYRVHHRTGR